MDAIRIRYLFEFIRYIVALCAGLLGLGFVSLNWGVYIEWIIKRKQISGMPLIGGVLLCIAFAIVPNYCQFENQEIVIVEAHTKYNPNYLSVEF